MSEKHELPSDSDEDDEDYIPEGHESVSELESDGDAENSPDDDNKDIQKDTDVSKRRKRCKSTKSKDAKRKKKQKRKSVPVEKEVKECAEEDSKAKLLSEEEEKKRGDSLWADFMKDMGVVSKPKSENSTANISLEKTDILVTRPKVEEKVKITKIFEFAGEKVKVEKEVPVDSTEARLSASTTENFVKNVNDSAADEKRESKGGRTRKVGLGGISSIIGQLGKKSKISTLEKSKLDWENFKKEENIEEEISTHNKGKGGYLEKQDFLQRADLRQFEIEKQLRTTSRRSNR